MITFANSEDASLAFNSSEAVMNNRFIKMFWASDKGNVKNRLGGRGGHHHHQGGPKVVHGDAAMEEVKHLLPFLMIRGRLKINHFSHTPLPLNSQKYTRS